MIKLIQLCKLLEFIGAKLGPITISELIRNPVFCHLSFQLFNDFLGCLCDQLVNLEVVGEVASGHTVVFPLELEDINCNKLPCSGWYWM